MCLLKTATQSKENLSESGENVERMKTSSYLWFRLKEKISDSTAVRQTNTEMFTFAYSWQSEANNRSIRFSISLNEFSISKVITEGFTFINARSHISEIFNFTENIERFLILRGENKANGNCVTSY